MFEFFSNLLSAFVEFLYFYYKFILTKFFVLLVMVFTSLSLMFLEVSWEVAKELIQLSNISQYLEPIFSILPGFLRDFLVRMGIFDFLAFLVTVRVTIYVTRFIPFI